MRDERRPGLVPHPWTTFSTPDGNPAPYQTRRKAPGGCRDVLRRLEDGGVATEDGRKRLPGEVRQRRVERRDQPGRADRPPHRRNGAVGTAGIVPPYERRPPAPTKTPISTPASVSPVSSWRRVSTTTAEPPPPAVLAGQARSHSPTTPSTLSPRPPAHPACARRATATASRTSAAPSAASPGRGTCRRPVCTSRSIRRPWAAARRRRSGSRPRPGSTRPTIRRPRRDWHPSHRMMSRGEEDHRHRRIPPSSPTRRIGMPAV